MSDLIVSLGVYISTATALFLLMWHSLRRVERDATRVVAWEIVVGVLLLAVVAGLRWGTGYDHQSYYNQYMAMMDTGVFTRHNYEVGFEWITRGFVACRSHYTLYFGFWALLQAALLFIGLRDRKHLLPWLSLVLVLNIWYIHFMNTIRQGVVECLFVALVPLIAERRFWPYAVCVLLASLINRAALLLLPVYLLCYAPLRRVGKPWLAIGCLSVSVLIGLKPVWLEVFRPVFQLAQPLGFGDWYQENMADVLSGNFRWVTFGPARLMGLAAVVMVILLYPAVRKRFKEDKALPVFYLAMVIGECLHQALINTSFYFLRPTELLTICTMVMIAYSCSLLWQTRRRWQLAVLLALTITYVPIEILKASYTPTETNVQVLYYFFFSPI